MLALLVTACSSGDSEPPRIAAPPAPQAAAPAPPEPAPPPPEEPQATEQPATAAAAESAAAPSSSLTVTTPATNEEANTGANLEASLESFKKDDEVIGAIIEGLDEGTVEGGLLNTQEPFIDTSPERGVVWSIETTPEAQPKPEEAIIPEGQDPSLAEEALAAAFALVRQQRGSDASILDDALPEDRLPPKQPDQFRIALLLPGKGKAELVARDIQDGAELAIFKLAPRHLDLVYFDTSDDIDRAVRAAIDSQADAILGPLFSSNTAKARRLAETAGLPIISFSNDIRVAAPGVYLLGQTPEQEIEIALNHALANVTPIEGTGRDRLAVAIISQQTAYGVRVADHAASVLEKNGIIAAARVTFNKDILQSEDNLRAATRNLTVWEPSPEGKTRLPPYDIVVLAGDVPFSLRVAPVLAWYDVDAAKTRFIGTSLWSSPAILQEPSLMRGLFATAPMARREVFAKLWKETGSETPGKYAPLGFDAVALTATLTARHPERFRLMLTSDAGFAGFSGMFRLRPDGSNIRLLDVHEITGGGSRIVAPAPEKFDD